MAMNAKQQCRTEGGIVPWVFKTTPLQGQQQADDTWEEQRKPDRVELSQLLPPRKTRRRSVRNLQQEQDENHRGTTDRQVDIDCE